jgi:hypothetical protein
LEYIPGPPPYTFQKTGSFEEKIDYFYMAKTNNDDNYSREINQSFNLYTKIRIRKDLSLRGLYNFVI